MKAAEWRFKSESDLLGVLEDLEAIFRMTKDRPDRIPEQQAALTVFFGEEFVKRLRRGKAWSVEQYNEDNEEDELRKKEEEGDEYDGLNKRGQDGGVEVIGKRRKIGRLG